MQPKALELINKYKSDNQSYIFPILSSFHKTEEQQKCRRRKVMKKINKRLKLEKTVNLPP